MFVVSIDSSKVISGSIPGSLLESMLLPLPGLPISSALCPPAAAISRASFAVCCPFMSEKSSVSILADSGAVYFSETLILSPPEKCAMRSIIDFTP